jgi:non-heme Fe2+,alpha-ketoglutarate-dependent halogenase
MSIHFVGRARTEVRAYDELGFVRSIPVLTADEVRRHRDEVERTCGALGGDVVRLDAPHRFFAWAWELSTHPRLLDALEPFVGADIVLRSTRLFYKHGGSASYVGWHQDGVTEKLENGRVPAVWLGLTDATVLNGCLRVAPGTHRRGLIAHVERPDPDNLTAMGTTAVAEVGDACDVVMRAGEMSLHHPLLLHSSGPNRSAEARIGFSATYGPAELAGDGDGLLVRGRGAMASPPMLSEAAAVAAYRNSGFIVYGRTGVFA